MLSDPLRIILAAALSLAGAQASHAYDDSTNQTTLKVSADGRTAVLAGYIMMDTVKELRALPASVQTLVLASYGGDIFAAEEMADMIRERGYTTSVPMLCWSACTLMFQAGRHRIAQASASFMYHRVQFHGAPTERARYQKQFTAAYLRLGMEPDFAMQIEASTQDLYLEARDLPNSILLELLEESNLSG